MTTGHFSETKYPTGLDFFVLYKKKDFLQSLNKIMFWSHYKGNQQFWQMDSKGAESSFLKNFVEIVLLMLIEDFNLSIFETPS